MEKVDRYQTRIQAIKLSQEGIKKKEIASILQVSESSIYKWLAIYKAQGLEGLKEKSHDTAKRRQQIAQEKKAAEFKEFLISLLNRPREDWYK